MGSEIPEPLPMLVIRTLEELLSEAAGRGLGGVLVPTMGALHEGHAALIRHGADLARREGLSRGCGASIFVNPTQFDEKADFERYPRTMDADLKRCEDAGALWVFAPALDVMYSAADGGVVAPVPKLPRVATEPQLEDRFRPGHFAGVCQVVMRLFRLLDPDRAVFGEKDWQQLQVVTAMAREAGLRVKIEPHATLRDPDGLAMSSRNRFLSADERRSALAIPRALHRASEVGDAAEAEGAMARELDNSGLLVEYAVVRDAALLGKAMEGRPGRALIAARAGKTRLIDNMAWPAR